MAIFKPHKVVGNLPDPLEPDAMYLVRVGDGFDFYASDSTGNIAHKINGVTNFKTVNGETIIGTGDVSIAMNDVNDWAPSTEYHVGDVAKVTQVTTHFDVLTTYICRQDHVSMDENDLVDRNLWVFVTVAFQYKFKTINGQTILGSGDLSTVVNAQRITQADYDFLSPPDPNTIYIFVDAY